MKELDELLKKMVLVKSHVERNGTDPLLQESLIEFIEILKLRYGVLLTDKLFELYDDLFEDDDLESLENYVFGAVQVFADELEEGALLISIKASPVRIELTNQALTYCRVVWTAA